MTGGIPRLLILPPPMVVPFHSTSSATLFVSQQRIEDRNPMRRGRYWWSGVICQLSDGAKLFDIYRSAVKACEGKVGKAGVLKLAAHNKNLEIEGLIRDD